MMWLPFFLRRFRWKGSSMITLRMLKESVRVPESGAKLPTWKELRESGTAVCARKQTGEDDAEVSVYETGYVLYRIGTRYTVFPINLEDSYTYSSVTDEPGGSNSAGCIPADCLEDAEWYFLLILIGEDRLQHNLSCRDRGKCVGSDDFCAEDNYLGKRNYYASPVEEEFILHEQVDELMGKLNDLQKEAIHHIYWEEQTHEQAAREMGYKGKSGVANVVGRALRTMRKAADDEK